MFDEYYFINVKLHYAITKACSLVVFILYTTKGHPYVIGHTIRIHIHMNTTKGHRHPNRHHQELPPVVKGTSIFYWIQMYYREPQQVFGGMIPTNRTGTGSRIWAS